MIIRYQWRGEAREATVIYRIDGCENACVMVFDDYVSSVLPTGVGHLNRMSLSWVWVKNVVEKCTTEASMTWLLFDVEGLRGGVVVHDVRWDGLRLRLKFESRTVILTWPFDLILTNQPRCCSSTPSSNPTHQLRSWVGLQSGDHQLNPLKPGLKSNDHLLQTAQQF